jgi:hypothetical protein
MTKRTVINLTPGVWDIAFPRSFMLLRYYIYDRSAVKSLKPDDDYKFKLLESFINLRIHSDPPNIRRVI